MSDLPMAELDATELQTDPAAPRGAAPGLSAPDVDALVRQGPIVLFDGHCNLCNGAVDFLIRRDRRGTLRFASLQSDLGRALAARAGLDPDVLSTFVLVDGSRTYVRSTAALRAAAALRMPWPLLGVLRLVPRVLRDAVYDWVARNRIRWFGRKETCRLPSPEEAARFVG